MQFLRYKQMIKLEMLNKIIKQFNQDQLAETNSL